MYSRILAALAIFVFSMVAFAQEPATPPALGYEDSFQLNYLTNITAGTSFVTLTNAGFHGYQESGSICANVYVFSGNPTPFGNFPSQKLVNCCSVLVTGNALQEIRGLDLVPIPIPVTVKILFSTPRLDRTFRKVCNETAPISGGGIVIVDPFFPPPREAPASVFASGGRAWATRLRVPPAGFSETEFSQVPLGQDEFNGITGDCKVFQSNSGAGGKSCINVAN